MRPDISILVIIVCFGLTIPLALWVRRMLLAKALLDKPNARSSHKHPVPRGGGWALLIVLVAGMISDGLPTA